MKKQFLITTSAMMALLFSGCSTTTEPNPSSNNIMDTNYIDEGVISIDEGGFSMESENEIMEQSYINSKGERLVNGSKDGFQSVYFDYDKYTLSSDMQEVMNKNFARAARLNKKLRVEGNCDSYGSDEYNYALGLKRANGIKGTLQNARVAQAGIVLVSYGESRPLCQEETSSCRKSNRRVDFSIIQ